MQVSRVNELTVEVLIDEKLYDLGVINKTFYWYLKEYKVSIESENTGIRVQLQKLNGSISNSEIEILSAQIPKDLLDFQVRKLITQETKNVRDLLIAKAFSESDEFDELPPGNLKDTVGENNFQ